MQAHSYQTSADPSNASNGLAHSPPIVGPWSAEEIEYLRARYPLVHRGEATAQEIAHFLDRTRRSVIARANRLGLSERLPVKPWSGVEAAYLRKWYPLTRTGQTTARALAIALGRTRNSVIAQANRLGLGERRSVQPSVRP